MLVFHFFKLAYTCIHVSRVFTELFRMLVNMFMFIKNKNVKDVGNTERHIGLSFEQAPWKSWLEYRSSVSPSWRKG